VANRGRRRRAEEPPDSTDHPARAAGARSEDPKEGWPGWLRWLSNRKIVITLVVIVPALGVLLGVANAAFDFGSHVRDATSNDAASSGTDAKPSPSAGGATVDPAKDAEAFRVVPRLLLEPCGVTGGAVGWGALEKKPPDPTAWIPAFEHLGTDLAFAQFGTVSLAFNLPKTSKMAAVEVTSVRPEITALTHKVPDWAAYFEGCGGGEYYASFQTKLLGGKATTERVSVRGKPTGDPAFEPFTVNPGEFEHMDYTISACDRATYDVQFRVDYRTDQGVEKTLRVPADHSMTFSSVTPASTYAPGNSSLKPVPASFAGWPPDYC
jgi:hypothetical protein